MDAEAIRRALASLNLPISLVVENVRKGGFAATAVRIEAEDQKKHRHLHHVEKIISDSGLTAKQKDLSLRIFRRLAEAEAGGAAGEPARAGHGVKGAQLGEVHRSKLSLHHDYEFDL